ncbi:MAG: hypothetical protein JXR73_09385 [Candidatus Omnitrophica bacterium]|nr:hypothetical protein [Candidatus Omnitrophota bacterium]
MGEAMRSDHFAYNQKLFVILSAVFVGCMATLMQVVLFREQMALLEGNELTLSLMLAWWLSGISLGALLPKHFSIDWDRHDWLPALLLSLPLTLAFCAVLIRLAPWWLSIPPQENPSPIQIVILSAASVMPASLLIGFLFPLLSIAMKNAAENHADALTVGRIFFYEALGSFAGGILLLLRLVPRFSSYEIAGLSLGLIALVISILLPKSFWRKAGLAVLAMVCIIFWSGLPHRMDQWSAQARWDARQAGYRFIQSLETPYQRLELGERDEQYTVFGNGAPLFSYPDEYAHSQWAFMSLSQNPDPRSILLIGNAGGEFYPYFVQHQPQDYWIIEMDAGVKEIVGDRLDKIDSQENPSPPPTWVSGDAIRFFGQKYWSGYFDLAAVNQPDPTNAVINRYYTREFFTLLRRIMSDEGIAAFSTTGTPNYQLGDVGFYAGTLYWTLRDVFEHVLVVPGTEWWFFAGANRDLLSDPAAVIERFKRLHPKTTGFSPEIYSLYYDAERIEQTRQSLERYRSVPRNTDSRPLCYLYNLLMWSKKYGYLKWLPVESLAASGRTLMGMGIAALLGLYIAALAFFRLFTPRSIRASSIPLVALFFAGFSSLAAETAILLFFQSCVGYLYQHVGIFFGVFMLGLAAGALAANRFVIRRRRPAGLWLTCAAALFSILLALSPAVLSLFSHVWIQFWVEFLLLFWLGVLAFLMGCLLPIAARTVEDQGIDMASLAGWIDASDCAGGALGALITGLLLAPLIGLMNTFYGLAGLNAFNVLILFYWLRKKNTQSY